MTGVIKDQTDCTTIRLVASYFSPFALPRLAPGKHASRGERERVHRINMLNLQPFMRRYIFRSGQLVVGCFIASLLFASLLPFPPLAIAASIGVILAVLHTVLLIFMQQWVNQVAAREGPNNDQTER
ncbi:hypothetical protein [Sedimenticola selenatireducens]|uniref:hypothetical protein n=1 Tax=Sedimenticola selenatireducens TaxID=191960 RepID=UPI000491AC11|nr:hypothetical protein [Sedimenticola selenatireducens]